MGIDQFSVHVKKHLLDAAFWLLIFCEYPLLLSSFLFV